MGFKKRLILVIILFIFVIFYTNLTLSVNTFSASSTTINPGQQVSLTWNVGGVSYCTSNAWPSESKPSSCPENPSSLCSQVVSPTTTITYRLQCSTPGGNENPDFLVFDQSITVTVTPQVTTVVPPATTTTVACCSPSSLVNPCSVVASSNECSPGNFIGNCQPPPDLCKRVCCTVTDGTVTNKYILPKIECTRIGTVSAEGDLQTILPQCSSASTSTVSSPKCSDYGFASVDGSGNLVWGQIGNLNEFVREENPTGLHHNLCNPDAFSIWKSGNDLVYFIVQGNNYGLLKGSSISQGTLLSLELLPTALLPSEFIPTDVLLAYAAPNEALAEPPTKFFASKGDLFKVCNEGGCSTPTTISGTLNLPPELIPPDSGSSYASVGEGNKAYYYFTKGRKVGRLDSTYQRLGDVIDLKNSVNLKKWPKSLLCPKTTSIFAGGYLFTSDGCKALKNSCTGQIEESIRGYNFEVGQKPFIVVITNKGEASKGIDIFVRKVSRTENVLQDFTSTPTYSCPSSSNQVCVYQFTNSLVDSDFGVKYQYYAKVKDVSGNELSRIPTGGTGTTVGSTTRFVDNVQAVWPSPSHGSPASNYGGIDCIARLGADWQSFGYDGQSDITFCKHFANTGTRFVDNVQAVWPSPSHGSPASNYGGIDCIARLGADWQSFGYDGQSDITFCKHFAIASASTTTASTNLWESITLKNGITPGTELNLNINNKGCNTLSSYKYYTVGGTLETINCNAPPPNECFNEKILRRYYKFGRCSHDPSGISCKYDYEDVFCTGGCNNGVCTGEVSLTGVTPTVPVTTTTVTCPAKIDVFDYDLIVGKTAKIEAISNKPGRIEIFATGLTGTLSTDLVKIKTCDNTKSCNYTLPLPIPDALIFSGSIAQYYAELTVNNPFEFVHSVTKLAQIGNQGNTNNYCKDERTIVLYGGANSPGDVCGSAGSGQCNPGYCSRSYSGTGDVGCFRPNNCVANDAFQTIMSCPTSTGTTGSATGINTITGLTTAGTTVSGCSSGSGPSSQSTFLRLPANRFSPLNRGPLIKEQDIAISGGSILYSNDADHPVEIPIGTEPQLTVRSLLIPRENLPIRIYLSKKPCISGGNWIEVMWGQVIGYTHAGTDFSFRFGSGIIEPGVVHSVYVVIQNPSNADELSSSTELFFRIGAPISIPSTTPVTPIVTPTTNLVDGYWNNLNNPLKGIDDELCGLGSQITSRVPSGGVTPTVPVTTTTVTCPAKIDVFDYDLIVGKTAKIEAISNKPGRIEIFATGLTGTLSTDLVKIKTCDNTKSCNYTLPLPIPGALSLSGSQANYYAELTVNNPFEFVHSVTKRAVIGDQTSSNNYCKDERTIVISGGANSPGVVCISANSGQCNPGYCSRSYSGTGDVGCFYPNNCVANDAFQTIMSCPTSTGTTATCSPTETCGNNVDDNCNGQVDEGCNCNSASRPCPLNQGVCLGSSLSQTCNSNIWSTCNYNSLQNYNQNDVCGDHLDNNCNGQVDEICSCVPGERASCGSNVGTCRNGTKTCQTNGQWGNCIGSVESVAEVCTDSLDNNCDNAINDGCSCSPNNVNRSCGTNLGNCRMGVQICTNSLWGQCNSVTTASLEVCDGIDNNCDGTVDEGCNCNTGSSRQCGSDTGLCRKGTQNCVSGQWSVCTGGVQPTSSETCGDNLDNDCDGTVDEGCGCTSGQTRDCPKQQGVCSGLTQTCENSQWRTCNYNLYNINYQSQETSCNDGKDNDCDGKTDNQDEDCVQLIQTCTGGISYGSCDSNTKPKYCTYGRLEDRCTICGCPVGQQCRNSDGVCVQQTSTNLRGSSCGNGNCEPGEASTCPEDCAAAAETKATEKTTEVTEETSKVSSLWWLWLLLIIFVIFGIIGYYYYKNNGKKSITPGQVTKKEGFMGKIKNLFKKPPKQPQQPQYVSPYAKYTQRYQWKPPQNQYK